jgi:hypothetical protein
MEQFCLSSTLQGSSKFAEEPLHITLWHLPRIQLATGKEKHYGVVVSNQSL